MSQQTLSLSEIVNLYKKSNPSTTIESIQEFYGYFVTASALLGVVFAPDPATGINNFCLAVTASGLNIGKLTSWLPDKLKTGKLTRETHAHERYKASGFAHFFIFNLAVRTSIAEILMPVIKKQLGQLRLDESEKGALLEKYQEIDEKINYVQIKIYEPATKRVLEEYAEKIASPLFDLIGYREKAGKGKDKDEKPESFPILDSATRKNYYEKVQVNYNAFLLSLAKEFPEFALWLDTSLKQKIISEFNLRFKQLADQSDENAKLIIKYIEELHKQNFNNSVGFSTFQALYKELFQRHADHLFDRLNAETKESLEAHHNEVLAELEKPLINNKDIEDIVYPKAKDIYIAQAFDTFNYAKSAHGREFLTTDFWQQHAVSGENIGNLLLEILVDPKSFRLPVILLGNPGAGKSMFSRMFAATLASTNDYVPFLIKLRDVASNNANVAEHISRGLAKSIGAVNEINWYEWARAFPERIPVIILDGFDELMQFTQGELNNYINAIRDFQDHCMDVHKICVKVILTSRITVMQEVSIPDHTQIIKLRGFDDRRIALWTKIWNQHQKRAHYRFQTPDHQNVLLLAKEPLLLFMLAVYDFETSGGLQEMVRQQGFNQSKLYHELLENFAHRQLEKDFEYERANEEKRASERELFRLRLGVVGLLMFLTDTTSRDDAGLFKELTAFGLQPANGKPSSSILSGFFFIHENQAIEESNQQQLNYEFLHKTFGEFLAADFLLRITRRQLINSRSDKLALEQTFHFCFGSNWLYRHQNILKFLIEHAKSVLTNEQAIDVINNRIKDDLAELFNNGCKNFISLQINLLDPKQATTHLAIYSNNLVYLWFALTKPETLFDFDVFETNDIVALNEFLIQDDVVDGIETNKNKILWRKLCGLWSMIGGRATTAAIGEWLAVTEKEDRIQLTPANLTTTINFYNAAQISCDYYEEALGIFDMRNDESFSSLKYIKYFESLFKQGRHISEVAMDAFIYRLGQDGRVDNEIIEWLTSHELSERQCYNVAQLLYSDTRFIPIRMRYRLYRNIMRGPAMGPIIRKIANDIQSGRLTKYDREEFDFVLGVVQEARHFNFETDYDNGEQLIDWVRLFKFINLNDVLFDREYRKHGRDIGMYEDLMIAMDRAMDAFFDDHHGSLSDRSMAELVKEIKSILEMPGKWPLSFLDRTFGNIMTNPRKALKRKPEALFSLLTILPLVQWRERHSEAIADEIQNIIHELTYNRHSFVEKGNYVLLKSLFEALINVGTGQVNKQLLMDFSAVILKKSFKNMISEIERQRRSERNISDFADFLAVFSRWNRHEVKFNEEYVDHFLIVLSKKEWQRELIDSGQVLKLLEMLLVIDELFDHTDRHFENIVLDCYNGLRRWLLRSSDARLPISFPVLNLILRSTRKFSRFDELNDDLVHLLIRSAEYEQDVEKITWLLLIRGIPREQIEHHIRGRINLPVLSEHELHLLNIYDQIMNR